MKVACDRCLRIVEIDFHEYDDWLILTTNWGSKHLFCKECSKVYYDTMFYEEKDDKRDES